VPSTLVLLPIARDLEVPRTALALGVFAVGVVQTMGLARAAGEARIQQEAPRPAHTLPAACKVLLLDRVRVVDAPRLHAIPCARLLSCGEASSAGAALARLHVGARAPRVQRAR
jgi:hypothetical protein